MAVGVEELYLRRSRSRAAGAAERTVDGQIRGGTVGVGALACHACRLLAPCSMMEARWHLIWSWGPGCEALGC